MGRKVCCVDGCDASNTEIKVYNLPRNDKLRAHWLSYLVPHNSRLLTLNKYQAIEKVVCQKHFESCYILPNGKRILYGFPTLFTEKEFIHGVPLSTEEVGVFNEHNYCGQRDEIEETSDSDRMLYVGRLGDPDFHEHPFICNSFENQGIY